MICRGILLGFTVLTLCVGPTAAPTVMAGKNRYNFKLRAQVDAGQSTDSFLQLQRTQGSHLGRCSGFCDQIVVGTGICFGTMCLCSANGDEIQIFYVIGTNEDYVGDFQVVQGSGTGRLTDVDCRGVIEMIVDSRGKQELHLLGRWTR